MHTLRSPKDFTGPDLDIPCLTYQSWHEACFGKQDWENLDLIPRELWAEYLLWFRRSVGLTVCNGSELLEIAPAKDGLLAATVASAGAVETLHARKIVLATGQEAMGNWTVPEPLRHLPARLCARSSDPIDFEGLEGQKVAVIGAGATAFDNAATALEAGAAEVHLLCRRAQIQLIQPYRWLTFRGFCVTSAISTMPGAGVSCAPSSSCGRDSPQATYDRCARFANFHLHEGSPVEAAREVGNAVELRTPRGIVAADFVVCGTGTHVDFAERRELRSFAGNIATWADRYQPRRTSATRSWAAIRISPTTMRSPNACREKRPGFPIFACLHSPQP